MGAISCYPKPTEQDAKKSLTITNRTGIIIDIGEMKSTRNQVRFVLVQRHSDSEEKTKWIADLAPDDTIEFFFNPASSKPIEK